MPRGQAGPEEGATSSQAPVRPRPAQDPPLTSSRRARRGGGCGLAHESCDVGLAASFTALEPSGQGGGGMEPATCRPRSAAGDPAELQPQRSPLAFL